MKLSCNRHFVSGAPAGSPCPKCAPVPEKKIPVDTKNQMRPFAGRLHPKQVANPQNTERTQPAESPPTTRARSFGDSLDARRNATQLQKRPSCKFCGRPGTGVTWGLETCRECGGRLNMVADKMRAWLAREAA